MLGALGGASALLAAARLSDPEFGSVLSAAIILGARRHAGPGGFAIGSVAAAVASHTQRPVPIMHDQGLYASRQHSRC